MFEDPQEKVNCFSCAKVVFLTDHDKFCIQPISKIDYFHYILVILYLSANHSLKHTHTFHVEMKRYFPNCIVT